jgi:hypothetical protein
MKNKRDRFLTVAQYRTNQTLKYIRLLGNCSNRNNYEYSDMEVNRIFSAIDDEIRNIKIKFKSKKSRRFEL